IAVVVRSMQNEFLKSARTDVVLEVVSAPEEVKGASITLKQQILRADELLVEARVRVAFVCGGRGRPIPKALRTAMQGGQDRGGGPGARRPGGRRAGRGAAGLWRGRARAAARRGGVLVLVRAPPLGSTPAC